MLLWLMSHTWKLSPNKKRVITLLQTQNPHGIQGIDQGEAQAKPLTEGFGHRLQFIMAPSELLVTFPSMEKGLNHSLLALIWGNWRGESTSSRAVPLLGQAKLPKTTHDPSVNVARQTLARSTSYSEVEKAGGQSKGKALRGTVTSRHVTWKPHSTALGPQVPLFKGKRAEFLRSTTTLQIMNGEPGH